MVNEIQQQQRGDEEECRQRDRGGNADEEREREEGEARTMPDRRLKDGGDGSGGGVSTLCLAIEYLCRAEKGAPQREGADCPLGACAFVSRGCRLRRCQLNLDLSEGKRLGCVVDLGHSAAAAAAACATARQQRGSSAAAARQQPTCRADLCVMSCAVHVGGGSILCDGRWMRETDRGAREAERQTERQRAEWLVSCCDSTCGKTRKGATGRRLLTTAAVRVERNDRMPSSRKPAAAKLHHGMA